MEYLSSYTPRKRSRVAHRPDPVTLAELQEGYYAIDYLREEIDSNLPMPFLKTAFDNAEAYCAWLLSSIGKLRTPAAKSWAAFTYAEARGYLNVLQDQGYAWPKEGWTIPLCS